MTGKSQPSTLKELSRDLRLSIIETHRLAGGGHLGSSLSIVESLVVLFQNHFHWLRQDEHKCGGDLFVLSKGHAALALYCMLALRGKLDAELLEIFGRNGSCLEPHPNENRVRAIHASTGSLGQGLSIGVGMALGSQLRATPDRVFVVIGDGELNEGQTWEAARSAGKLGLSNLIVILDDNQMQQDGPTPEIMPVSDVEASWRAMGWHCSKTDGHDCAALDESLSEMVALPTKGPRMVIAHTTKGRGIEFLEGRTESHFPPPLSTQEIALVKYSIERSLR